MKGVENEKQINNSNFSRLRQTRVDINWTLPNIITYVNAVGFEVLAAVSTKMAVFWVVVPCSLVEVYRRFGGPCCLHHQGATTQKTAIYVNAFA
jgi:hypothetical protein